MLEDELRTENTTPFKRYRTSVKAHKTKTEKRVKSNNEIGVSAWFYRKVSASGTIVGGNIRTLGKGHQIAKGYLEGLVS